MASINATQAGEVTYISGVTPQGTVAAQSFWAWNDDSPATYGPDTVEAKWGPSTAGTGATITYAFDPASNWTAVEKAAFVSTMDLWSAVANVTFTETGFDVDKFDLIRGNDGGASGGAGRLRPSSAGSSQLGTILLGSLSIDTSVASFGPLGSGLSNYGGYPWQTLLHEEGHVLGLGHAGPYNEGNVDGFVSSPYDTRAWSIMSYNQEGSGNDGNVYRWGSTRSDDGLSYHDVPVTWMPLDILAVQRLYGVAVDTPLSGGQTFGFHTNIQGDIAKFFDFDINPKPIVTLWDKGTGNSLDLSGFSQTSMVDLHDGAFSSAAGLGDNIAIAFGTRIDTVITGTGNDQITANDDSDVAMGGAGADSITGGNGNDHLYGAAAAAVAGDGADTINGGAGSDYLQGNAGDDRLDGGDGSDRIQGGQGNDGITGGAGNDSVNGNLGNDTIDGGDGNDSLRGGQGTDSISGGAGDDLLIGDLGTDTLTGGAGIDIMTGGGDADQFNFASGEATFATSGARAGMTDMITDFTDGVDHIHMGFGVPGTVIHSNALGDFASAATVAQQLLGSQSVFNNVAALAVGGDTYVFYQTGPASPLEAFKLAGFADATAITTADFV